MALDLDRFKRINDGLGPHVGDAVLREAARRIAAAVRSIDLVARRGGDEFVVVMPSVLMEAVQLARALLAGVACPMTLEGHEVHLTCSIGIAMAPADGDHADAGDSEKEDEEHGDDDRGHACSFRLWGLRASLCSPESLSRQRLRRFWVNEQ